MRRLVLLSAALVVVAAACSTATSEGFTDSSGEKLTAYEFAEGDFTYEMTGNATGSIQLGDSLKKALPSAVQTALDLVGESISLEMGFTAEADAKMTKTDNGQTLELTYTSITGSTSVAGQKSDVTLDDLDQKTAKYEIGTDGKIQVSEDPLADKFWLTGSGVASCPSLPSGGAEDGKTWSRDEELGGVFGFFAGPISLQNSYKVDGDSSTVDAETTDLNGIEIRTKDIIERVNDSLSVSIPTFDVNAAVNADGEIAASCTMSVPGQELEGMDQTLKLDGALDVSGGSLPSGLEPGTLLEIKLDSTASLKAK